jgi:hypothetical protein
MAGFISMSKETPQDVVRRCLDFWREDLYASNGVATPFATDAIIGELLLAGYGIVDLNNPEHNLRQAKNGRYYCADSLGMMCAGNWNNEAGWHRHLAKTT